MTINKVHKSECPSLLANNDTTLRPPTPLCKKCQPAFDPWPRPYKPGSINLRWYDTVAEAHESASNGCALCIQFVKNGREKSTHAPGKNVSNVGKFAVYSLADGRPWEDGMLVTINMYWFTDPVKEAGMESDVWSASAFLIPGIQQGTAEHVFITPTVAYILK
jgi:hypothetical protein